MTLTDDIRAARARWRNARHVRDRRGRGRAYAARCPPSAAGPRPRRRGPRGPRRLLSSRSTRSTSARAGSPRCASPGCRASGRSRPACARTARGRRRSWPASRAEVARAVGQDPGHELMALFARAARARRAGRDEHDGSFLALARSGDGSAVALAERLATLADVAGRLALRRAAGAVLQARPDRRRRPALAGLAPAATSTG